MSFIERHLNISPDGGDGSIEFLVGAGGKCRCGGVSSRDEIERDVRFWPLAEMLVCTARVRFLPKADRRAKYGPLDTIGSR